LSLFSFVDVNDTEDGKSCFDNPDVTLLLVVVVVVLLLLLLLLLFELLLSKGFVDDPNTNSSSPLASDVLLVMLFALFRPYRFIQKNRFFLILFWSAFHGIDLCHFTNSTIIVIVLVHTRPLMNLIII
jgi:hypothetical protein